LSFGIFPLKFYYEFPIRITGGYNVWFSKKLAAHIFREATMIEGMKSIRATAVIETIQLTRSENPVFNKTDSKPDDLLTMETQEDRVSLNRKELGPFTYTKPLGAEQRLDNVFMTLRKLVAKILQDQQTADQIDNGNMEIIDINKITPEKAKALVANDGHWKPEQTAARIVAFSIAIAGNDPTKIDRIKENLNKGFQLAKEALGGKLTRMSKETYSAVMQKLDDWARHPGIRD
jgi:hypothetical protein